MEQHALDVPLNFKFSGGTLLFLITAYDTSGCKEHVRTCPSGHHQVLSCPVHSGVNNAVIKKIEVGAIMADLWRSHGIVVVVVDSSVDDIALSVKGEGEEKRKEGRAVKIAVGREKKKKKKELFISTEEIFFLERALPKKEAN